MPEKDYDFTSLQEEVELEEEKLLPKGKVVIFPNHDEHLTLLLLLLILSMVILAYVLLARFIFFSWPFN